MAWHLANADLVAQGTACARISNIKDAKASSPPVDLMSALRWDAGVLFDRLRTAQTGDAAQLEITARYCVERMITREFAARLVSEARLKLAQEVAEKAERELLAELAAEEQAPAVRAVLPLVIVLRGR